MRSEAHGAATTRPAPTVKQSLREYGRGVAGGLLFSLPLLFTMEMWDAGATLQPWRLLVGIVGVFILLLGYNRYAGLHADACLSEVVVDSVEEFGIGLLLSAGILWLIGSIDTHTQGPELVGKIVLEGLAVAIGVSVGTAQLGGDSGDDENESGEDDEDDEEDEDDPHQPRWFLGQLTLATCGAVLIAANIAPTDEIPDIARTVTPVQQLGLTAATLLVAALVLYASDFHGARDHVRHRGRVDVVSGTVATYLISIGAAATLLWFFGRFDDSGLSFCLAQSIVLGLPTAIGASAGRLLLQPSSS